MEAIKKNHNYQKICCGITLYVIFFLHTTLWAQTTLHDAGLNIIYKETLELERDIHQIVLGCLTVFKLEESRIKLMADNLYASSLYGSLLPWIQQHIEYTYAIIDVLDRNSALLSLNNGPWGNNKFYTFFFNRSKRAIRQKVSILDKNMRAYLDYSNHMPEGDRLVLIFDALIELNKYVLEFASLQFSEISKYKKEKDIFMR